MKLSTEDFIRILAHLRERNKFQADNTSSQSDLVRVKIHPELLKSARDCRIAVVGVSMLALNPIQEEDLKKQLLAICEHHSDLGEWKRVKEILLTVPFSPGTVLAEHMQDKNLHDFYGNDIKKLERFFRTVKYYNPYSESKKKVKYPQRKRGYDDKGHLPKDYPLPRVPEEERKSDVDKIQVTNSSWWENLPFNRNMIEQETLMRKYTSQEERRTQNGKIKKST